jgi:hypothetical protein
VELEKACQESAKLVEKCWETSKELQMLFKTDYAEFVRDRKRWKSDF